MNTRTAVIAADPRELQDLNWAQRQVLAQLEKIRSGTLEVRFPGLPPIALSADPGGTHADISFHRPLSVLRRVAWRGDLGFAEAYMAGDWTSDDPARLLQLLAVNQEPLAESDARSPFIRWLYALRHRANHNSRKGSRRNISAHYDLGNDFYAQWLDASMTYSAALFDGSRDLETAQTRKYQRVLEMTGARRGDRVLEIGCGWGGFAEYAARQGVRVVGLTLSSAQLAYAQQRIAAAGLSGLVDLRLCDYRDFDEPVDHIVSIEMFEAVGREYWQGYFDKLAGLLKRGGRAALQVITIDESLFPQYEANPGGFIQTYIFPGGMLPTKEHLDDLGKTAGLRLGQMDAFGIDYADTLKHWYRSFHQCSDWLQQHGYDERFRRMWGYYLAFCEAGFRARQIDVVHCAFEKG